MLGKKLSLLALPLVAAVSLQAQHPLMNDPFKDPFFQDPFGDDIFKEMMQMQRQMDEMFSRMQQRINQRSARLVHPSMGMYRLSAQGQFVDKGDHYELVTNIPESKENKIDIRTQNGMLTLSAKIVHEEEQKTNGMVSVSKSVQSYQQTTSLPTDADEGKISSTFKNGRLVITVGKKQGSVSTAAPKAAKLTPKQTAAAPEKVTPKAESGNQKSEKSEKVDLPRIEKELQKKQPAAVKEEKKKETLNDQSSMS